MALFFLSSAVLLSMEINDPGNMDMKLNPKH